MAVQRLLAPSPSQLCLLMFPPPTSLSGWLIRFKLSKLYKSTEILYWHEQPFLGNFNEAADISQLKIKDLLQTPRSSILQCHNFSFSLLWSTNNAHL